MYDKKYRCPHCGVSFYETAENTTEQKISYGCSQEETRGKIYRGCECLLKQPISAVYHYCPACHEYSVQITGPNNIFSFTYPPFRGLTLPEYIPAALRNDYNEACAILDASPKAAATLARRCLQGMIHDYWGVNEGNLAKEIAKIKEKIPADQYRVLDGVRRLGNIGAHMEKDVNLIVDIDPGEAQKLIKLLELLMKDWYIARHDREELYNDILAIDQDKQQQRHSDK